MVNVVNIIGIYKLIGLQMYNNINKNTAQALPYKDYNRDQPSPSNIRNFFNRCILKISDMARPPPPPPAF